MKATPKNQQDLLELQRLELEVMRTNNQMKKHPLLEKLQELAGRSDDLRRFIVGVGAEIEDQRREVARLEGEIEKVRLRGATQQERLEQGKVPVRDMSAVEHEIRRINMRVEELEGELLQQMEELEAKENAREDSSRQAEELASDEAETKKRLDVELADPKAKLVQLAEHLQNLRETLPSDILVEYDRLRERQGPIVVLELRDGNLVNSPVSLSAAELSSASTAPADELWISQETGYLVARPA